MLLQQKDVEDNCVFCLTRKNTAITQTWHINEKSLSKV